MTEFRLLVRSYTMGTSVLHFAERGLSLACLQVGGHILHGNL